MVTGSQTRRSPVEGFRTGSASVRAGRRRARSIVVMCGTVSAASPMKISRTAASSGDPLEDKRGHASAAPTSVTMGEFARTLGRVLGRPAWAPAVPLLALRLALGEMGESLVPGQRVVPAALREAGYTFRQPTLETALQSCVSA